MATTPMTKVKNLGPNLWLIRWDGAPKLDGSRNQKKKRIKGTKKEAEIALATIVAEVAAGTRVEPSRMPLSKWVDRWLEDYAASRVRETTLGPYRSHLKAVKADLGHIALGDLTTHHIQLFSSDSQQSREARTVHHELVILKQALQQAVEEGLLVKNPAGAVKPPRPEKKKQPALEPQQVNDLLAAVEGTILSIPVRLGVGAGLRESEALGLRWAAVRMDQNLLWVERVLYRAKGRGLQAAPPKTETSRRPVTLSGSVVAALRQHQETGPTSEYVVCMEDGRPMRHEYLSKKFGRLMDVMGTPEITFHSLRRTHASLLAHAGVMPRVVQERLGHADSRTTQEIYTTIIGGADWAAAEAYEQILAD